MTKMTRGRRESKSSSTDTVAAVAHNWIDSYGKLLKVSEQTTRRLREELRRMTDERDELWDRLNEIKAAVASIDL